MISATVYNAKAEKVKDVQLDAAVFGVAVNPLVVQQAVVAQQANARASIAHTKTRGEVRGGGKKPWKQKGTGRARHGSTRSPIWVGGGITFGPRNERNWSVKINKKVKRKALCMTLSAKLADNSLVLVNEIVAPGGKTKELQSLIKAFSGTKSALIVLGQKDANIVKAVRNIPHVQTILANSLNVVDVLKARKILVAENGLETITATYKVSKKA